MSIAFAPGDLVYARGREWVALPSPDADTLCLRPLSGAEADAQLIHPALEREPVRPARFELPSPAQTPATLPFCVSRRSAGAPARRPCEVVAMPEIILAHRRATARSQAARLPPRRTRWEPWHRT